jgi:hypothetical protein
MLSLLTELTIALDHMLHRYRAYGAQERSASPGFSHPSFPPRDRKISRVLRQRRWFSDWTNGMRTRLQRSKTLLTEICAKLFLSYECCSASQP